MYIFGIPRVHRVLICIWFALTPPVLTLDLVKGDVRDLAVPKKERVLERRIPVKISCFSNLLARGGHQLSGAMPVSAFHRS